MNKHINIHNTKVIRFRNVLHIKLPLHNVTLDFVWVLIKLCRAWCTDRCMCMFDRLMWEHEQRFSVDYTDLEAMSDGTEEPAVSPFSSGADLWANWASPSVKGQQWLAVGSAYGTCALHGECWHLTTRIYNMCIPMSFSLDLNTTILAKLQVLQNTKTNFSKDK